MPLWTPTDISYIWAIQQSRKELVKMEKEKFFQQMRKLETIERLFL